MKVAALAGGVGAARLLSGVVRVMDPSQLSVIVNTGDDFEWNSLRICPDIDTVIYTLAGKNAPVTGWGIAGDTFACLDSLTGLGADPWFRVGDRDLATHLYRTQELRAGRTLREVTRHLARRNGVAADILPMTDGAVSTRIVTRSAVLSFQDWFVRRKCVPRVRGIRYAGASVATPAPGVLESIRNADLVIVCPSNPILSIGPMLAVPGIRRVLRECRASVVGVSPLVGGKALKGPTASLMLQLGHDASATGVASLYRDFLDVFIIDTSDARVAAAVEAVGPKVVTAPIVMDSAARRRNLAQQLLGVRR